MKVKRAMLVGVWDKVYRPSDPRERAMNHDSSVISCDSSAPYDAPVTGFQRELTRDAMHIGYKTGLETDDNGY